MTLDTTAASCATMSGMDALLDRDLVSDVQLFFIVAMGTACVAEVAIFWGLLLS